MILAQVEHVIVHETRISSGAPVHIYIAAIAATVVAIIGWFVVHRTSQNRDLLNWRRTALMQSVTSLIEASNHRFEILHKKDALRADLRKQYGRMQVSYDQIRICGSDEVFSCASQLMEVHLNNENEITRFQGWMTEFPALKTKTVGNLADLNDIKPEQLYAYHHTLISEVQIQLKLVSRKDAQIFTWKDESKKDQEI